MLFGYWKNRKTKHVIVFWCKLDFVWRLVTHIRSYSFYNTLKTVLNEGMISQHKKLYCFGLRSNLEKEQRFFIRRTRTLRMGWDGWGGWI